MRDSYVIKAQELNLSVDKAWLLGHIAGDGHLRYAPECRTNSYNLGIAAGLDKDIAEHCVKLLWDIYGAASTIRELQPGKGKRKHVNYEVKCYRKQVVEDIRSYGTFGIHRWKVPEKVLAASIEIRAAWLCGFFDAEGGVYWNEKRHVRHVAATSVNHDALQQVSAMLLALGIRHTFALLNKEQPEKGWSASYRTTIHFHEDVKRYRDIVGFRSPTKSRDLAEMSASYERELVHRDVVKGHESQILARRALGETHAEIAQSVGLERETVAAVCYRNGVEPEGREGNADDGKRSVGLGPIERLLPQILSLREDGAKDQEIADTLGLGNPEQVRMAVLRARRDGKVAPVTTKLEELLPKILALRDEGKTFREIGESLSERKGQKAALWIINYVDRAKRRGLLDDEGKIRPGAFDEHRTGRSPEVPLVVEATGIKKFANVIEAERREGVPIAEIARKIDYSEGAVKKAIREDGLVGKFDRVGPAQSKLPEILALQKEGLSFQEIADRLGLTDKQTVNGVLMWARRIGRIPTEPKTNKTLAMAEKVAALRAKDWSYGDIANELGTDPSTACKSLKKAIERGWIKVDQFGNPLPSPSLPVAGSGQPQEEGNA